MHVNSRPLVFVACLALLLVLAARFWGHTVDDAFISFRYADNLVGGDGLVFNPGERVEGYTNFLWVLLNPAEKQLLLSRRFHDEYRAARGETASGFFAFFVRHDRAS